MHGVFNAMVNKKLSSIKIFSSCTWCTTLPAAAPLTSYMYYLKTRARSRVQEKAIVNSKIQWDVYYTKYGAQNLPYLVIDNELLSCMGVKWFTALHVKDAITITGKTAL